MKMRGGNSTGITAWVMYITPQDHPLLPSAVARGRAIADDVCLACTASTYDDGEQNYTTACSHLLLGSELPRREQLKYLSPGDDLECDLCQPVVIFVNMFSLTSRPRPRLCSLGEHT